MVSIRLSRGGAKKHPFYHIVVTDSRNRRDGRYIERLGFFNPVAVGKEVPLRVNLERAQYWLGVGAKPSERVAKLIKQYAKNAPESTTPPTPTTPTSSEVAEPAAENTSTSSEVEVAEPVENPSTESTATAS